MYSCLEGFKTSQLYATLEELSKEDNGFISKI